MPSRMNDRRDYKQPEVIDPESHRIVNNYLISRPKLPCSPPPALSEDNHPENRHPEKKHVTFDLSDPTYLVPGRPVPPLPVSPCLAIVEAPYTPPDDPFGEPSCPTRPPPPVPSGSESKLPIPGARSPSALETVVGDPTKGSKESISARFQRSLLIRKKKKVHPTVSEVFKSSSQPATTVSAPSVTSVASVASGTSGGIVYPKELGDLVRKSGYCVLAPACPMWVLKEVSEQLRERKLASIGRLNPGSGSSISLSTRHALNPVTDFIHGKIKTPWTFHAAEKKVEAVVPEAPKPASGFDSDTDDEYTAIQTTKTRFHSSRVYIPPSPFERLALPYATFHYKIQLLTVELPDDTEILHMKDSQGHHYLTVEDIDGKLLVTIGVLKNIVAELANPILTTRRIRYEFDPNFDLMDAVVWAITMTGQRSNLVQAFKRQLCFGDGQGRREERRWLTELLHYWLANYHLDFIDPEDDELLGAYEQFIYTAQSLDIEPKIVDATRFIMAKSQVYVNEQINYLERYDGYFLTFEDAWVTYWSPPSEGRIIRFSMGATADQLADYLAAVHLVMFRDVCTRLALRSWLRRGEDPKSGKLDADNLRPPTKKPWQETGQRVELFLQRIEVIIHWVVVEILQTDCFQDRAETIELFIDTAGRLKTMGDLYGAYCIVRGLSEPPVGALETSWELVTGNRQALLQELRMDLVHEEGYNRSYRQALAPVVPRLDFFLESIKRIHQQKDSSVKHNRLSKTHRDVLMESLGGVDVSHYTNIHIRPSGPAKQPDKLDVLKYYRMKETILMFKDKSEGKFALSDSVKRYWLVFRIHVPSVHALKLASPAMPTTAIGGEASRLFHLCETVETRMLQAWIMGQPHPIRKSGYRRHGLRTLLAATGEVGAV